MTTTTISRFYYDPARPSAFSTLQKLRSAWEATKKKKKVKPKSKNSDDVIRACLDKQDACTLHRPVRKRFARNSFTVNNVMDVSESDLLDVEAYAKYKDNYRYILSVIDVFSKFLYMIAIKTKSGPSVASAFRSIFDYLKYSKSRCRPICVRTDKRKEFLNIHFQDMLQGGGIQFYVCRNPDLKCTVVERVHRTIRDRIYKYFTF